MNEAGPLASPATLEALEFPSYLRLLASLAATDLGAARLSAAGPARDDSTLHRRHRLFHEASRLLIDGRLVPSFEEPLGAVVAALGARDTELVGVELKRLAAALGSVRKAARAIEKADPECPELERAAAELGDLGPLVRRIGRTLDRRGRVRDDASDRLVKLGGSVRRSREEIYGRLREYAEGHKDDLAEETLPMHDGRVVLLLKAGSKSRGRGLVHRGSGTGRSVYFEPLAVVDSNNQMREAQAREEEERRRLLRELVEEARAAIEEISRHLDFLALLDALQALHDFAELCDARPIEISERHVLKGVGARHPLLEPRLADLRERALGSAGHVGEVVPLDLELAAGTQALVITGPNAGGKTVALKTVGLMALAAQAGLPFPAARGSCAPRLAGLVATVGDEQDLLQDRSTFSGRLLRLREAWDAAGPDSLVLLDELGSGTDPEEGAALSIALLEGLLARGSMALITTHLTPLAGAALERDGAACAAMQFDASSHRPTFELQPGSPAGSEALALGRRLGLPGEWLDRADELLGGGQRDLRRLLAEVESVRDQLRRRKREADARADELEQALAEADREREKLERERVESAARTRAELDAFKREIAGKLRGEVERMREQLEAGRKRGLAGKAVERLFEAAPAPEVEEPEGAPPAIGDQVEHRRLGWKGRVERLERGRVEVSVHGKRMRCAMEDLRVVAAESPAEPPPPGRATVPDAAAVTEELNLIGHRVEEALELLDAYLDRALLSAEGDVRIVHGHGTGRLRKAVREHLRHHPAAATARPGRADEGGDGATVVSLRG